jgi:putative transposase
LESGLIQERSDDEETVHGSTDCGVLARGRRRDPVKELCRKHGFSEASYYLWRSKFGGMSVSDAKRLKELEIENGRLKKLLADSLLENEVTREVLRKKW